MRKIIFLLSIFVLQLHAQTNNPILVWYDIDLADTTIDGLSEKNIPLLSSNTKLLITDLFQEIKDKKYATYYRLTLDPTIPTFTFPVLYLDTSFIVQAYPPYDESIEVTYQYITLDHIEKIRIYETWKIKNWDLNQTSYDKKMVGWSFILRPKLAYECEEESGYPFNRLLKQWVNNSTFEFEPYLFLSQTKNIDFFKKALNHDGEKHTTNHEPFVHRVEPPESNQNLLVYDMFFPDTIKTWKDDEFWEENPNWDMPHSRISFLQNLYTEIDAGKYLQYKFIRGEIMEETKKFPISGETDTALIENPYPPFEMHDTVFIKQVEIDEIIGIRYYEVLENNKKLVPTDKYNKKIIAWTFLKHEMIRGRTEEPSTHPCPYIFLFDKSALPFLKQKLNR